MKTFFLSTLPALAVGLIEVQRRRNHVGDTRRAIEDARTQLKTFKTQNACGPECRQTDAKAKVAIPYCWEVVLVTENNNFPSTVNVKGKSKNTDVELTQCTLDLNNITRKVKKWSSSSRLNMNKQRRAALQPTRKPAVYKTRAVKPKPVVRPAKKVEPAGVRDQKAPQSYWTPSKKAGALLALMPAAPTGPPGKTIASTTTASTKPVNSTHESILKTHKEVQRLLRGARNKLRIVRLGKNASGTLFRHPDEKQAEEMWHLHGALNTQNTNLERIDEKFNAWITAVHNKLATAKQIPYRKTLVAFQQLKTSVNDLHERIDRLYVNLGKKSKTEIKAGIRKQQKDAREKERQVVVTLGVQLTGLVEKLNDENYKAFSTQIDGLAALELQLAKRTITDLQLKDLKGRMHYLTAALQEAISKQ